MKLTSILLFSIIAVGIVIWIYPTSYEKAKEEVKKYNPFQSNLSQPQQVLPAEVQVQKPTLVKFQLRYNPSKTMLGTNHAKVQVSILEVQGNTTAWRALRSGLNNERGEYFFDGMTQNTYKVLVTENYLATPFYVYENVFKVVDDTPNVVDLQERGLFDTPRFCIEGRLDLCEREGRVEALRGNEYIWTFTIRNIGNGIIKQPVITIKSDNPPFEYLYLFTRTSRGLNLPAEKIKTNTPYILAEVMNQSDYVVGVMQANLTKLGFFSVILDDLNAGRDIDGSEGNRPIAVTFVIS